jgi:alkaline phosphatase
MINWKNQLQISVKGCFWMFHLATLIKFRQMNKLIYLLIFLQACHPIDNNKGKFTGHSHNDYYQSKPFFTAWENYFASIEADVWAVDGQLYIAHDFEEITPERTLENLYLKPIDSIFKQNNGKAWKNYNETFILLVDFKTSYDPTLDILVKLLQNYLQTFDPNINPNAARIVISGNMPLPENFHHYPSFISFDGRMENTYTTEQLERIALFSNSIKDYVNLKDYQGQLSTKDEQNLTEYINKAHSLGKKVRFWAAPDEPEVWKKLKELGVDFINTDSPAKYYELMSQ